MLLQSAATVIPVPFIQEAIAVALKIIEICEVSKILPRRFEIVHSILLSEYIYRREKGQRSSRYGMPSNGGYHRQCYIE